MKKLCFVAASAGLFLVSNAPVGPGPDRDPRAYPPCSRTVTDNCVQRGEPESRALDAMPADEASGAPAMAHHPAPAPAPTASAEGKVYPPCSATVRDSCQQGGGHARPVRVVRYAKRFRHAGERG